MELYFLRHARAKSRINWSRDDSERPLTERGQDDAAHMAGFLAKLGVALDAIITSPYSRASATADIVADHLNMQDRLVSDDRLAPGFSMKELRDVLGGYPEADALMFVGHEPDFSGIVSALSGGRVTLKKGGIAYIEAPSTSPGKATLIWLVQPSVLGA